MLDPNQLNFLGPYLDKLQKSSTNGTATALTIKDKQGSPLSDANQKNIQKQFQALMASVIDTFNDTMSKAKQIYYLNVAINIIVVIFGVVLLSLSMYSGFSSKEFTPFSSITAAVGVADFVALFFINPQTKTRRSIADLAQMQMIYTNYCLEAYSAYNNLVLSNFNPDDFQKFQDALKQVTIDSVKAIEDNIGNEPKDQSNGASSQNSPKAQDTKK